jgi:hypothetical protein
LRNLSEGEFEKNVDSRLNMRMIEADAALNFSNTQPRSMGLEPRCNLPEVVEHLQLQRGK